LLVLREPQHERKISNDCNHSSVRPEVLELGAEGF